MDCGEEGRLKCETQFCGDNANTYARAEQFCSEHLELLRGRRGPENMSPRPFSRPVPLNGQGRGVFFGIPCPCPPSGPLPAHTPDGSRLKIGGNKPGPIQGMCAS